MKRFIFSLPALLFLSFSLTGQDSSEYEPPTNLRVGEIDLQGHVDLTWTPPSGWAHSIIDMWYDYDKGIWDGNRLGSCMDCPAEAAIRWDAIQISMYDTVYLTKIRYVLTEPEINYKLRVYQGTPESFDTLLNFPLVENLVYLRYDTINLEPILLNTTKDLWIGYWVNSLASGFPLPFTYGPSAIGYGNMFRHGLYWEILSDINPDYDQLNWSIGGYLETPNDSIIYPLFNVYRAYDDLPFEKVNENYCFDTVYFDKVVNHEASIIQYYVTSVYEDGESEPSDTLTYSFVNNPEIIQQNKIKISPNPAKDRVSIDSGNGRIQSLSLINTKGEVVLEKLFNTEKVQLDLSGIPSSFYILKVITEDGMFTSKLLIYH